MSMRTDPLEQQIAALTAAKNVLQRNADEWKAKAEGLEAERDELKRMLDMLTSEKPCPDCGCGVSARCYGCMAKRANAERDAANATLAEVAEWRERHSDYTNASGECTWDDLDRILAKHTHPPETQP